MVSSLPAIRLVEILAPAAPAHLLVAITAIHRPAGTRLERHFGVDAAVGALHFVHLFRAAAAIVAGSAARTARAAGRSTVAAATITAAAANAITIAAASLAALAGCPAVSATGGIAETSGLVEFLFTCGEGELLAAITARQRPVSKRTHGILPQRLCQPGTRGVTEASYRESKFLRSKVRVRYQIPVLSYW
jgi:hypothetical protein